MLHTQNSTQLCETVDQIIDYFLKNPEKLKLFQTQSAHDKSKHFSDILKNIKSSPKNYKMKNFIQDLAFIIQSFLQISEILEALPDKPYIISSLFYESNEFKCLPASEKGQKQKIQISVFKKTKLTNYLNCLSDFLSEDQEILELLITTNAFEIIEGLKKILNCILEISEQYDISETENSFKDIIKWIMKCFKVFLCEKNLTYVIKMINEEKIDQILRFFAHDLSSQEGLEILVLLVKFGSIDLNFQNFMKGRNVLKNLAIKTKKIDALLTILDLNFFFEFPSFNKNDINAIQKTIKQEMIKMPETQGADFIHKIYQFSFCDFNLVDQNYEKKKNNLINIQKESNGKYIRQNFMEKIIITPSFIEILISYYEELSKSKSNSFLRFEILHKILDLFDISHKNFFIIESEFKMIQRLIESLLIIDSETSHILLKIINYVITMIIPENNLTIISEEMRYLSVVLSKCKDTEVLIKIFDLLKDLLSSNPKNFQAFLRETEVFSGILSQFLGFFKDLLAMDESIYSKISEVLKNFLLNNEKNLNIFQNFNIFTLMVTNMNKTEIFNDLIIFFLEEQAKLVSLEPFLLIFLNKFQETVSPIDKIRKSECLFNLLSKKNETTEIFRDSLLKKYKFFHKYIDLFSSFEMNNEDFAGFCQVYFQKLKKYLICNKYFVKYFRKKNLFLLFFKSVKTYMEMHQSLLHSFLENIFAFSTQKNVLFKSSENTINTVYTKINHNEEVIILFPEIFNFLIEYISKCCSLTQQLQILQEIKEILCCNENNIKILNQVNFLQTLGIIYHKEIKTSLHPFYELLLDIIYKIVKFSPKFHDIKLIETIMMAINQEISDNIQQRNKKAQENFIEKINDLIKNKCFHPFYLKFSNKENGFGSIMNIYFPRISGKLINDDNKLSNQGFTFSLWIKSNYKSKISKTKFYIFHLKPGNSNGIGDHNTIEIFLEKNNFFLKFMQSEAILLNNLSFNDKLWHQITFSFSSQSSNLIEFNLYMDGISLENRILNAKTALSNEIFNANSQLSIFYDLNSTSKSQNEGNEYFLIGPLRLLSKPLTFFEVNLLYCTADNYGINNFFNEAHSLNWGLISFSNLRFFEILQNRKEIKSLISYTKSQVLTKINHFSQFLLIECDSQKIFYSKNINQESFCNFVKKELAKNNQQFQSLLTEKSLFFILNKADDHYGTQGFLIQKTEDINLESFYSYIYKNTRNNFIELLEKSNFIYTIFELLEKAENRTFFLTIHQIFIDFIEKSQFFYERFETESLYKVYLEILKKKSDFFQKDILEKLLFLFCRKINFVNRNLQSINLQDSSSHPDHYWLLNSLKIGKEIIMDSSFFQIFLNKSSLRLEIFEIIYSNLLDPSKNLFSSFNKYALRNSDFLSFLFDLLVMDSSHILDTKIFDITKCLIKPSSFLDFDQENLKKIYEFTLLAFFPSYRQIENITKIAKRRHLESIDNIEKFSYSRKTSTATNEGLDLLSGTFTARNNKKLAISANFTTTPNHQALLPLNSSSFSTLHKFEAIVNIKRFEMLQIKLIDFLISLHEFPQTNIPVKNIINIMQARAISAMTQNNIGDQKNLTRSLCKLLSLSVMHNENKKTFILYEGLPLVLKSYCNENYLYYYLFMSVLKKMRWDINDLEFSVDKNEKLPASFLKIDDISLLINLLNFLYNSLNHLKLLISFIQNSDNLIEISQIIRRNLENQSEKRFSLMEIPKNEDFFKEAVNESDEEIITPGFLNLNQNQPFVSDDNFNLNEKSNNKSDKIKNDVLEDNEISNKNISYSPNEFKIDENSFKDSPSEGSSNSLLKIFNVAPIKTSNVQKHPALKTRAPSSQPKKKVNISSYFEVDSNMQKNFKEKLLNMLIHEEDFNNPSNSAILSKNLLKYFNENIEQDEFFGYMSLPNFYSMQKCLEKTIKLLTDNKTLFTKKNTEKVLITSINILQIQIEISNLVEQEKQEKIQTFQFIDFIGFGLSELLFNEVSAENDLNFNSFSKYFKIFNDLFTIEKVSEILKVVLETILEKIEEKNLVEYCRTLKKTFLFIFPKLISFPLHIDISWFGNCLVNILKKFFYFNSKGPKEAKSTSGIKSFFNKIGIGSNQGGDKSPMVKFEFYEKMSKKDKSSINDFKYEFQMLLRRSVLFEINRSLQIFKENHQEEIIVDRLKEYEENEKIIFDEEFENTEFYQCLFFLFGELMESKNKNICIEIILFLSYIPYHIPKDSFRKLFIINECNLYEKGFDMLLSIKNNHSEDSSKKTKTPLDFYIVITSPENTMKFEVLNKKKYSISWANLENTHNKTNVGDIYNQLNSSKDKSLTDMNLNSSLIDVIISSPNEEEKKNSFLYQENLKRWKSPFAEKTNLKISDVSEIDNFFSNSNNTPSTLFFSYFISHLEKKIKEYLLRKLVQKLENENCAKYHKKYESKRIMDQFFESNPYLEKALKKHKKELVFYLENRTGLFMQRSMVMNKIRTKTQVDLINEDLEFPVSPTKRYSMIKKTSGVEILKMPDSFPIISVNEVDNLPEYTPSSTENLDDMTEMNKEEYMLDTEIEIEETDDYVFVSEQDGTSKIFKDSLFKLKRMVSTNENIENFYPITYLKNFGFVTGLLVVCKRNLYILRNWGYDEKQGIYDFNENSTNQHLERDKFQLINKGTNIQLMNSLRKTTLIDESTIMENPLDLNKSGYSISCDMEMAGLFGNRKKFEEIKIPIEKIIEINTKRYLLSHCAIEIHTIKKTYFLIVGIEKRQKIFEDLKKALPSKLTKPLVSKENFLYNILYKINPFILDHDNLNVQLFHTIDAQSLLKFAVPLWQEGILDNFEYLMLLNNLSGRTYNDLGQYPVFPWVLKNFSGEHGKINLNSPENYRDLAKPIGALIPERAKTVKETYNENLENAPFHYGSHYSNPGIVTYYLMRLMPFGKLAMELQGGKFDFSDRLFSGIKECWETVEMSDFKELVPEFYYLPDFLLNVNRFNLGTTSASDKVNDVILPKWALCNPRFFVMFLRKALESIPVSQALNEWIDLIFGFKQFGKAAIDALNIFYILTYEGMIDLKKTENMQERNGYLDQIAEFGQTPRQLFNKAHPQRKRIEKTEGLFYDLSWLKTLICTPIGSAFDLPSIKKQFKYIDFYLNKELIGYNFDRIAGLGSFIKLKVPKVSKEDYNDIKILKQGTTLFGTTSKSLNYTNCYSQLILYEEKPERRDFVDILCLNANCSDISALHSTRSKKWLIVGTHSGMVYLYKIVKKKENLRSEINSSCHFHRNSTSSMDFTEDKRRQKARFSFKFAAANKKDSSEKNEKSIEIKEGYDILLEERLKSYYPVTRIFLTNEKEKDIAFLNKNAIEEELSINSYPTNNSLLKKNKTSLSFENQKKSLPINSDPKILIEFVNVIQTHNQKITCIQTNEVLCLLLTADEEGVICVWDLEKAMLVIKIHTYHFLDLDIYKDICFENAEEYLARKPKKHNKYLSRRESIIDLSFSELNNDFCVISSNYASLYNINGVLISIIHKKREKLAKFSACLVVQNKARYEDDYLVTGHEDGKIIFWIISPNKTIPAEHLQSSQNVYFNNYSKKYQFDSTITPLLIPYKLELIHSANTPLKIRSSQKNIINIEEMSEFPAESLNRKINSRQINKLYLSTDQKRLFSLTINGDLFQWSVPDFDDKKCDMCNNMFGVFDKKQCSSCCAYLCSSCYQKYEAYVPTKDFRKADKVCEKCFQKINLKGNYSLYDNY